MEIFMSMPLSFSSSQKQSMMDISITTHFPFQGNKNQTQIGDVQHTVSNTFFLCFCSETMKTLSCSFMQRQLTICPSKKCISHIHISYSFFPNPFCLLKYIVDHLILNENI